MPIIRKRPDTRSAPPEWFTGPVWLDRIAFGDAPSRLRINSVHFAPGGRTAWHTHPLGQILHVTEGEGYYQEQGGPLEIIRAGDTVVIPPDVSHWHGAQPANFMTHLAVQEADDNNVDAVWGEHVTHEEYSAQPA